MGPGPHPTMSDITVTTKGVEALIERLNPKKAIGPDLISTRILKEYSKHLAPVLKEIFQQSLDTGDVPKDWRHANITAIYKKARRQDPANYRPVSLTSVSCKTLEHIIFSHTMSHLDISGILVDFQHGFRSRRSTETQLILTIDDLAKNLDESKQIDMCILDFSKAFDKVPHQRLASKLEYYGIRGQTKKWKYNWLTSRVQQVVVDGETSREEVVRSGVLQGMVLG